MRSSLSDSLSLTRTHTTRSGAHPVAVLNLAQLQRKLCHWESPDWAETTAALRRAVAQQGQQRLALVSPYLCEVYGLDPEAIRHTAELLSTEAWRRVQASALVRIALQPFRLPLHARRGGGGGGAAVGRLRVGYASVTGLNSAQLSIGRFLQTVLAMHQGDGSSVEPVLEAWCYGWGHNDDGSSIFQRLSSGCTRMVDVRPSMPLTHVLSEMRAHELHLVVDLTGTGPLMCRTQTRAPLYCTC